LNRDKWRTVITLNRDKWRAVIIVCTRIKAGLLLSLWTRTSGGLLLSSAQGPEKGYYYPSGQGPVKSCSEKGNKSSDSIKFFSLRVCGYIRRCSRASVFQVIMSRQGIICSQHPKDNMMSRNIGENYWLSWRNVPQKHAPELSASGVVLYLI